MAEYQILNLMQVAFIQNAMYFVGMVLFTWLGFRMANNIYNNPDSNMLGKIFTSIGAASAERMAAYLDFPLVVGAPLQTIFVLFILAFQLAITWSNK